MVFSANNELNMKLNLEPKLQEIKNCLKQWQHRKLTLLDKVTVIKTSALPKLIYQFIVLPSPSEYIIKYINKYVVFYWIVGPTKLNVICRNNSMKIEVSDIQAFLYSIKDVLIR